MEVFNTGGTPELVKYLQERSDDIEKVVIPQSEFIRLRPSGQIMEAGLVIHMIGGNRKLVPNKQDAEAVLNDGILYRMKIKIELGV